MAEMQNAYNVAIGVEEVISVEEIANEYDHLHNCDPQTDMRFIEHEGKLVAYGGIEWRIDDEGQRRFDQEVVVDPAYAHMGLARAIFEFNEQRAREHVAQRPMDTRNVMRVGLAERAQVDVDVVTALGYHPIRHYFVMRHDLGSIPHATLPAGLELRPVRKPDDLRPIWDAKEAAFADHWGHAPRGEDDFRRWCEVPTFEPALWQVAWDTQRNNVAGLSINTIYHNDNAYYGFKRGFVDSLGVRREWRGQGVAKALLMHSLQRFQAVGMTEVMLGVDASNPTGALQLYEKVGFTVYQRRAMWQKEMESE